ncbi:MAG TPA: hypothetical protein VFA32_02805 [Dehalococcoidia bacterium]|jgi:hypothetical protein|nr:hypothetical protein [Dehalococcoidia bacterium]
MSNRPKLKPATQPRHLSDQERWERACQLFPDPLEDRVIALAEQEGIHWRRVPGFNGLRFFYDEGRMARFELGMAQLGQRLD